MLIFASMDFQSSWGTFFSTQGAEIFMQFFSNEVELFMQFFFNEVELFCKVVGKNLKTSKIRTTLVYNIIKSFETLISQ